MEGICWLDIMVFMHRPRLYTDKPWGRAERKSRAYFHICNIGSFQRFKELQKLKPEDIYITNQVYGQLTKEHVTYLEKLHLWDHIQQNQKQINKIFLLCLWGCFWGHLTCMSWNCQVCTSKWKLRLMIYPNPVEVDCKYTSFFIWTTVIEVNSNANWGRFTIYLNLVEVDCKCTSISMWRA